VEGGAPIQDKFRILSIDGGGMRGLIPALVLANLERRLQAEAGQDARLADYFHMFAGTSTGGLVALSLTAPARISAADLAKLYTDDGPRIFRRSLGQKLKSGFGWLGPKHDPARLREAIEQNFGKDTRLSDALREVIVTAYDMTGRDPHFFKRWRAREERARLEAEGGAGEPVRDRPIADAGLATSAAPTYFPSHEVDGRALVDGGVFASNPVIAAVVEALKRRSDDPHDLHPRELFVVSLGTGNHESGFEQSQVRRWGKLGWVLPQKGEPPVLTTVLGGSSDGADHWAHTLLNDPIDSNVTHEDVGRGPRFYRLQVELERQLPMDDAGPGAQGALRAAAERLLAEQKDTMAEITRRLLAAGPIPPDPFTPPA
jgi:uncharacterized protein